MGNLLLRSQLAVVNSAAKAKDAMSERLEASRERGDIVQTILIIAVFVGIIVVVGALLYKALNKQGDNLANCIAGAGNVGDSSNCKEYQAK